MTLAAELRALADDLDSMRDELLPMFYSGTSKPAVAMLRRAAEALEVAELAEREMALLMGDHHAPAYKSMDLIRQLQPMLRTALKGGADA